MSNKKNTATVRIMAWILAALMVLSVAYLTISVSINYFEQKKAAEEKEKTEQTDGTETE